MEQSGDIRWKQWLQNYQKALGWLERALADPSPDVVHRAGMVQFFEMTFELAWKVLKDYLENQGFLDVASPRSALKKAFELGLIADGRGWLKGLEDRDLTAHTYDEGTAIQVEKLVRTQYLPLFRALAAKMEGL